MPARLHMKEPMSRRTERKLNTVFKRATASLANAMVQERISISMADELSKMYPRHQEIVLRRLGVCC
jgi:hypothetical protein